jgi:tetratricopeptide (TPR) repeat protein
MTFPFGRERQAMRYGAEAEKLLREARAVHPKAPEICVELATLRLRVFSDPAGAADWFGQAAELPDAPPYAARIRAELLRQLGRPVEALACLKQALPALSPAQLAQRRVVEQRIADLERDLEAGRSL